MTKDERRKPNVASKIIPIDIPLVDVKIIAFLFLQGNFFYHYPYPIPKCFAKNLNAILPTSQGEISRKRSKKKIQLDRGRFFLMKWDPKLVT